MTIPSNADSATINQWLLAIGTSGGQDARATLAAFRRRFGFFPGAAGYAEAGGLLSNLETLPGETQGSLRGGSGPVGNGAAVLFDQTSAVNGVLLTPTLDLSRYRGIFASWVTTGGTTTLTFSCVNDQGATFASFVTPTRGTGWLAIGPGSAVAGIVTDACPTPLPRRLVLSTLAIVGNQVSLRIEGVR